MQLGYIDKTQRFYVNQILGKTQRIYAIRILIRLTTILWNWSYMGLGVFYSYGISAVVQRAAAGEERLKPGI